MSLLQRSLDPEKTLGQVDVLYTAIFDLSRWKERRYQFFLRIVWRVKAGVALNALD